MASFDAAIALDQPTLNQAAASIYQQLYPAEFTGSQAVNQLGIQTVSWDVTQAPAFNLSPPAQQRAAATVAAALWRKGAALGLLAAEELPPLVAANLPTFAMEFPAVAMTLVPTTGASYQLALTGVTASCSLQVSGNTISFVPQQLSADPLPNSTDQFFVTSVILPMLLGSLTSLLAGLTIPPFNLQGIALSSPAISILDGYLVAAVNLASSGPPAPVADPAWTPAGFSLLVSQNLLQASAASQGKSFAGQGSKGSHWAGIYWQYALNVTNPQVAIMGTDLQLSFGLTGSVSATAYLLHVPIGIGFAAQAVPTPAAVCQVLPAGSTLEIVTSKVSPFTVLVTPAGNIPDKIAGWMVEAVVAGVVAAVTPLITQFLGGIRFTSLSLPTYSDTVGSTMLTFTPANLSVYNIDGYLGFGGSLAVS